MPGCASFQIVIEGKLEETMQKARDKLSQLGMRFSGYTESGDFSGGGIVGNYTASGNVVTINITSLGRPASMVYDCKGIEKIVRDFLR